MGELVHRHSLSNSQAYAYLKHFSGIDFLKQYYEAEHTQSIHDAVDDLTAICHRNGGALV